MELIAFASLLLNFVLVAKLLRGNRKQEAVEPELRVLPTMNVDTQLEAVELTDSAVDPSNDVTNEVSIEEPVKAPDTSHSPWLNRTNIPWSESYRPTQQPVSPQKGTSGQLERPPYGFV